MNGQLEVFEFKLLIIKKFYFFIFLYFILFYLYYLGPGSEGDELHPHHHHYSDGSVENDLPMKQLSELFNINHFIVSQVCLFLFILFC